MPTDLLVLALTGHTELVAVKRLVLTFFWLNPKHARFLHASFLLSLLTPADTNRWRVGLQPFPKYVPPPPPADEQRTKEILAQVATIRGTAPAAPAAPAAADEQPADSKNGATAQEATGEKTLAGTTSN